MVTVEVCVCVQYISDLSPFSFVPHLSGSCETGREGGRKEQVKEISEERNKVREKRNR